MKILLGIQLNFSTSVQLLRAGTSPGISYSLLDSADAEYPICAPHWKSERLNSGWGKWHPLSTWEAPLMSPSGTRRGCHMAAWAPVPGNGDTGAKVMGEQAKTAHFTPGCGWCTVLGCCCPMARLSKAPPLGTCWSLTHAFPWLCNTLLQGLQGIPTPKTNTSRLPAQNWLWLFPVHFASLHVRCSCLTIVLVETALISSVVTFPKVCLNGRDSVEQPSKRQLFCVIKIQRTVI